MNLEYELALLRAFADSKTYEFKGFQLRYTVAHPEPVETAEPEVADAIPEPAEEPVVVAEAPVAPVEAAEEPVEPEKPVETVEVAKKPKPKAKKTVPDE